jgi:hypothetical protein
MTEEQHPDPVLTQPTTPDPEAATPPTIPAATGEPAKARRWLAGAMLVTVGLVAGSGGTYAFTSEPDSTRTGTGGQGLRGDGFPGGGMGGGTPPGATDDSGTSTTDDQPT